MFRTYQTSRPPPILKPVSKVPHIKIKVLTNYSLDDGTYLLISACKDGNPMLRSWLGDWIGTFLGGFGLSRIKTRS